MEGNIVVLTNQTLPEVPKDDPVEGLENALTAEEWSSVEDMMNSQEKKTVEIDVTEKTKEDRLKMHKALRAKYQSLVTSNSGPSGDKTIMKVFKHEKGGGGYRTNQTTQEPPFLEFVMYKENLSTMEAISSIARRTR